jgi:hypothetical protein
MEIGTIGPHSSFALKSFKKHCKGILAWTLGREQCSFILNPLSQILSIKNLAKKSWHGHGDDKHGPPLFLASKTRRKPHKEILAGT